MRHLKLDRSDIDSGNKDSYWSDLDLSFNDTNNVKVNYNRHPTIDECCRFAFDHSGFIGTSKKIQRTPG